MKNENKQDINTLIDVLDQVTLNIYQIEKEKHPFYYLDALTKVLHKLNTKNKIVYHRGDDNQELSLNDLIKKYNNEEIQQALLMLEINALKHQNYALDILIPDSISVISSFIMSPWIDKNANVKVLFGNAGLGQFALAHNSFWQHPNLTIDLIENDERCLEYLIEKTKLLGIKVRSYYEEEWLKIKQDYDLIIGDVRSEVTPSPEEFIKQIETNSDAKKSLYLVNHDFFKSDNIYKFKEEMEKMGQFEAFILLPDSFFQNQNHKKAFLLFSKDKNNDAMGVFSLPDWKDTQAFNRVLTEILTFLRR